MQKCYHNTLVKEFNIFKMTLLDKIKTCIRTNPYVKYENGILSYNSYRIGVTATNYDTATITLPEDFEKCDYIFVIVAHKNENEYYFVNLDDIAGKIKSSEIQGVNSFFSKRTITDLKKQNKIKTSLQDLTSTMTKEVKKQTRSMSIF